MKSGIDFLKAQVASAISTHASLIQSMDSHESEASDPRYRDLCERHLPHMREHQRLLVELQSELGAPTQSAPASIARAIGQTAGTAAGMIQSLADAPVSDYERLASDLDHARRLEVVFKTFRDGGRSMKIDRLAKLGEIAERHHDDYSADAKRLLLQMFVERVQGAADILRTAADSRADFRIS
jgi:hypothetical protein